MEKSEFAIDLSPADLFMDLRTRADTLLQEFRSYQAHLKLHKKQHEVEIRALKRGIESEVKTLKKFAPDFGPPEVINPGTSNYESQRAEGSRQVHALRSSNLSFYEAVWDTAKSCRCIVALGKKMYFAGQKGIAGRNPRDVRPGSQMTDSAVGQKKGVLVDIVANNGLEWIKVSTLTEKRLLFEMAKQGWEKYGDLSDESASSSDEDDVPKAGHGKLELVRLAEDLRDAARVARVHFRHPQIRFVLPKIREGVLEDVDAFLADLRATRATVHCSNEIDKIPDAPWLDLDRLMPAPATTPLTPTINVDCTILLALISDTSHFSHEQLSSNPIDKSHTYHKAILKQIEAEKSAPMLPREIYPLLDGRDLCCTSHAAQRMREIVKIMATGSERTRADLLLGDGQYKDQSTAVLRDAFGKQSLHSVPDDLRLPIKIIDVDVQELLSCKPARPIPARGHELFPTSVAARAKEALHLTPINASVFLYGWARQITTLTSNRTVASGLSRTINEILDLDEQEGCGDAAEFAGPLIYTCETARSLIGKAKG